MGSDEQKISLLPPHIHAHSLSPRLEKPNSKQPCADSGHSSTSNVHQYYRRKMFSKDCIFGLVTVNSGNF